MTSATEPPPLPGNWVTGVITRTGPWTIGQVWVDRDSKRYALKITPGHCNALGAMHGGAMATFLDGQAFMFQGPEAGGSHTPTISLHIDYLAPAHAGSWLVAEVILVKTTRTMIFTQAIASAGGSTVARSLAIYKHYAGKDSQ